MRFSIRNALAAMRRARRQSAARVLGTFEVATPKNFHALIDFSAVGLPASCHVTAGLGSVVYGAIYLERDGAEVRIGTHSVINPDTMLIASRRINIGAHVWISYGCLIMDHDGHALDPQLRRIDFKRLLAGQPKQWQAVASAAVEIADDAWIGARVILLKGAIIGRGAVVAAGAVVTGTVPPFTVYGGNPARQIAVVDHADQGHSAPGDASREQST